jgi:PAS domain S-box-containing protein
LSKDTIRPFISTSCPSEPSVSTEKNKSKDKVDGIEVERQAVLPKTDALQNAIFNSANFSSIATDAKGVIQIFNVGAERMLGYAASEVVNRVTPADISDPLEVVARAKALSLELDSQIAPGFEALVFKASRGIEDIYELTYIRKDGSRFPAVVSITALRDDKGLIIGYLLIGTDNTARKKAEEALIKASALQTAILTSENFSIIATDEKGIIQLFNIGAERMLGYHAVDVVNKINPSDIHDPQEVQARAQALSLEVGSTITPGFEALAFKASRGIEDIYELTYICKDGSRFPAIVSITALRDYQGAIIGYLLIGTDNSVRKRVELALIHATAQAEQANLAKSNFLSSMSHELRTPLSAILGFAQLLESGKPEPSPTQKRSIKQILQSGWYLLELINEILDLALIESGKLSLSLEPVSLAGVMQECETMMGLQAHKRGITIVFPTFNQPCFVSADHTRLKQVFINLLSNAIKYNSINGSVLIRCDQISPSRMRIAFEDTGAGLSQEKIARLFQPFNRLGQEANAEQGTGIGLVMTKRLTELMGGNIGVESTLGAGSNFWIEINTTGEQHLSAEDLNLLSPASSALPLNPDLKTLLYVEDNPANLMLVGDIIARRQDLRLLTAKDGISGMALARAHQPDLILMDINLPGISGIQAMQILSVNPCTANIPVIALSANAMPRDIKKGLEAGFFRYLTKPINITAFMHMLDEALVFSSNNKNKKIVK